MTARDSAAPSPALRVTGAAFAYGAETALEGVTLELAPGEAVALIGPNGAGKSTLLKGVLGQVPLVAGTIEVGGQTSRQRYASRIGYMPQHDDLDPQFPVTLEQVVMMGRYRSIGWFRLPGAADRAAVAAALAAVGLTDRAKRRFGDLSGGQQQRGILARSIVSDPSLLLLDEPFNGLDQENRASLVSTLAALKAEGVAVLVSTHDFDLAQQVCDRVLLLEHGRMAVGELPPAPPRTP
ncbi:metal ABC transporter ATP-binding protein [Herbiconiux sp. CPCC 203407]|uniref:Metal ABC transporter ATP-binding protein n=1 Tax=Herbiconiux oxytropis TaxID=2970915 RepID=A0AA41XEW3_9MICO|nr:metal ABC transporter ATP-binding protein [Herbiconiux oxytropis]MCS5723015.1 metal ABC transporter ATP-binding protein [Herbiconiux oxytropis]MCS5725173.1 metal ABC transporter ATP-binding protein [Herbiconiux oxytropis]